MFSPFVSWCIGLAWALYWLPLAICGVGYTIRTALNYVNDQRQRATYLRTNSMSDYYRPTDTFGDIVGRILISVIPVLNIWAVLFNLCPNVIMKTVAVIGDFLERPLVPKKD